MDLTSLFTVSTVDLHSIKIIRRSAGHVTPCVRGVTTKILRASGVDSRVEEKSPTMSNRERNWLRARLVCKASAKSSPVRRARASEPFWRPAANCVQVFFVTNSSQAPKCHRAGNIIASAPASRSPIGAWPWAARELERISRKMASTASSGSFPRLNLAIRARNSPSRWGT